VPEFNAAAYGGRVWIVQLLEDGGLVGSRGEARRLIRGGGVSIDGDKVNDEDLELTLKDGQMIKAGKRRFLKIKLQ
jgi:tyrosyl-tRNA synthetase